MITARNIAAIALSACLFGAATSCQKADNSNKPANQAENKAVTNTNANVNAATPANTAASSPMAANGPLADAYKTAYTARKNKDISGLKKVMSKDVLEFLTMMGGADEKKKKSLDDMLKELCERPQAPTIEARNEKIDGDNGSIEYLDEEGKWSPMDFVNEDGVWKLTIAKGDQGEDGDTKTDPGKKDGDSNK